MTKVDTILRGGNVVNVLTRTIDRFDIGIKNGRIVLGAIDATTIIDLDGSYISPGFIDAHMHVESTMLPPTSFAALSLPHGTTTAIFDPHEIANVLGIAGIKLIMDDAKNIPFDAYFAASSCVPASPLETSGATLLADDLEPLFEEDCVIALAEMMNFPGVIHDDPEVHKKIKMGLRHGKVDGHCPGLRGNDLLKYISAGISSDHESITAEEALDKLNAGMQIYIREGSAAKNLEALLPIITQENAHKICFCTDDRHPADLRDEGHIDHIIRKAILLGLDPILAICIATKHIADHYELSSIGSIEDGKFANLVVFDDLQNVEPKQTWHHGKLVADNGNVVDIPSTTDWTIAKNSVHLPSSITQESFAIKIKSEPIRVIGLIPGQLITEELHLKSTDQDILKMAVIERHHNTGNVGLGFVHGFAFSGGAIASTVGHDAHNIAVVGDNDEDMLTAAKALESSGGGQCVVSNGKLLAILPLPIAGLMSDEPPELVISQQKSVLSAIASLGCPIEDPFMPLSFLPLSVIPKLKLSDLGLVDVDQFAIVPIEVCPTD
ncbi:MAG: adenine deaminase [Phycisphaerales bacterium]|jgi:adenine deaminase|nr:adenine deaminase [Phycisphaerales bacterium]